MSSNMPSALDIRGSVLFLGSGFSCGATNIRGENLPVGQDLKRKFARMLGVNANDYDLRTLADEVAANPELNLYQTLYEIFTVSGLQSYQSDILRLSWRRIYTTNYDDAVEFAFSMDNRKAQTFSFNDKKPKKLMEGSVIHLHGVIRNATEETVMDQLVLNENAYVRQHFEKSLWYDDFERDLRFCSACFFVGYSLADYHVSALLMKNPSARDKTFFVTRPIPDVLFANRVKAYGTILPVGVEKFAELCRTMPIPEPVEDPHAVKAFRYLDPFKDKKTLSPPTAIEILNLVSYGTFNYQRCVATLPAAKYIVPRQSLADEAGVLLKKVRCLLVHSRIGNGKTIFLYILAHKLSQQGSTCFLCRTDPLLLQQDIQLLRTYKNLVLFFDSYNSALRCIALLEQALPEAKYVVAVRTGVQEVRLHEIQAKLPNPLHRLSLNGMQKEEINDFKNLLNRSGVQVPGFEGAIEKAKDFRDVVVTLYDNALIKEKIKRELEPLISDRNFTKIFVTSLLLEWVGQDVDAAFLRSVTLNDPYAEIAKFREVIGDVFTIDDDHVQVRSALFSVYLLQNHFSTDDILESVYAIILQAVRRKADGRYQAILSSLMRFSNLDFLCGRDQGGLASLMTLYERLRHDIDVNEEPLFWLQYSILMTVAGDLPAAEGFIRTAYARAADSPSFRTFQIDTYALKLFMLIEQQDVGAGRIKRFDQIIGKFERLRLMIGEESHRYHAIQVLEGIEPFVSVRLEALSRSEMNALVYHFNLLVQNLGNLSSDARAQTGADLVKASIIRAKDKILAFSCGKKFT